MIPIPHDLRPNYSPADPQCREWRDKGAFAAGKKKLQHYALPAPII